ncbi:MAG: hypothetical protein HZA31_08790 [Opitutae bacterium]|nr:hypothetical protein [Opitutae bacterium]
MEIWTGRKAQSETPQRSSWFRRRRKLFGISLLTLACAYFGLATAFFAWMRLHRKIAVAYADILLPNRWPNYRISLGDHFIAKAETDFRQQRWLEGMHLLRAGLARSPGNLRGRLLLADGWLAARRTDLAREVLSGGLSFHATNPEFVRALLALLLSLQRDDECVDLAKLILSNPDTPPPTRQFAAFAAASACYFRGRYEEATQYLQRHQVTTHKEGRLLEAQITNERGYPELALLQLRQLAETFPCDGEIYTALIQLLNARGLYSEMRLQALSFCIAAPQDHRSRIDLLQLSLKADDRSQTKRIVAEFLSDFPADATALLALSSAAARQGAVEITEQIREHCCSRGLPWEAAALLVVEAQIHAGTPARALASLEEITGKNRAWDETFGPTLLSLRALVSFGIGDKPTGQQCLHRLLTLPDLRAEQLLHLAESLLAMDAEPAAHTVLQHAIALDPLHQAALTRLLSGEIARDNLAEAAPLLPRLLAMRKPSADLLRVAHFKLSSDRWLFLPERESLLSQLETVLEKRTPRTVSR